MAFFIFTTKTPTAETISGYRGLVIGITGSVLLIIFKSLMSLCFITCLIRISLNLKNDQKNRPRDPQTNMEFLTDYKSFSD